MDFSGKGGSAFGGNAIDLTICICLYRKHPGAFVETKGTLLLK